MVHTCHAIGCNVEVPPCLLMCSKHWRMVPINLKREILASYRPGQEIDKKPSQKYLNAAGAAINAIANREAF